MSDQDVTIKIGVNDGGVKPAIESTKQAMGNLAGEVAGVTKQFLDGVSPLTIFADHSQQMISAISQMSGVTTSFVGLMSGPWGLAIASVAGLLGTLISKLDNGTDAEKAHAAAAKALENSIHELNIATGKAIETSYQAARASYLHAEAMRTEEVQARNLTKRVWKTRLPSRKFARNVRRRRESVEK